MLLDAGGKHGQQQANLTGSVLPRNFSTRFHSLLVYGTLLATSAVFPQILEVLPTRTHTKGI